MVNAFTALSSIFTLIVIAIDRYRRIRKPLSSQITGRHARLSLIPITGAALFFSSPALFVYGVRTVDSGVPGVPGYDCTISDQAKTTVVPLVYNGVLFIGFAVLTIALIVMYTLILRSLAEHARTIRKASLGKMSTGSENLVEQHSTADEDISYSLGADTDESLNQKKHGFFFPPDSARKSPAGKENYKDNSAADYRPITSPSFSSQDGSLTEEPDSSHCKGFSDEVSSEARNSPSKDILTSDTATKYLNVSEEENFTPESEATTEMTICKCKRIIDDNRTSSLEIGNITPSQIRTEIYNLIIDSPTLNSQKNLEGHRELTTDSCRDCYESTTDDLETSSHVFGSSSKEAAATTQPNEKAEDENFRKDDTHKKESHHVGFDVTGTKPDNAKNTDVKPLQPIMTMCKNKRKMSNNQSLKREEDKLKGYINPMFQLHQQTGDEEENCSSGHSDSQRKKKGEKEGLKKRNLTRKTTIIAFVVTLVFVISFVPHLCLQVSHLIWKGFNEKLQGASLALYNLFLRSYFINSVANPIIYGVMNESFRKEVKLLIQRLRCWKR